jgi:adenylate kinase
MKLALIGPVGSGKSTQAQRLSQTLVNYTRISSGALIRSHIEADTELGRELKHYYDRGEPVPDEVVLRLMEPNLQPAGFWILDGFPRTFAQAHDLDTTLESRGGGPTGVIALEGLDDEELIERVISGRRESLATGMVYHLERNPPPSPEERLDPGPFVQRADDTPESLRRQIEGYKREAGPLKQHYEERGILHIVDAAQPIPKVTEDILKAVGHTGNTS